MLVFTFPNSQLGQIWNQASVSLYTTCLSNRALMVPDDKRSD